jgi:gas vesicle protein
MGNNNSYSGIFLSVLAGAALGAGVALLFAPQSGRRTRRRIGELADEAGDYARGLMDRADTTLRKARRKGEAWMEKGQELMSKERQAAEKGDAF